jgi:hypothetical protein
LHGRVTSVFDKGGFNKGVETDILTPAARSESEKRLARLKEIASQPTRGCRLPTAVKSTQTDLLPIMHDARNSSGFGVPVKVNGTSSTLLLDTGAGASANELRTKLESTK